MQKAVETIAAISGIILLACLAILAFLFLFNRRAGGDVDFWAKLGSDPVATFAAVLAFVGIAQVVLILPTLILTRSSVEAARASADAAVSAINLSNRAELSANFNSWKMARLDEAEPAISFVIVNSGLSHAHILKVHYDWAVTDRMVPTEFMSANGSVFPALIGAKAETGRIVVRLPILGHQVVENVKRGAEAIFVRTRVLYQNAFGDGAEFVVTGRYGLTPNENGELVEGFVFPDIDVASGRFVRKLNFTRTLNEEQIKNW